MPYKPGDFVLIRYTREKAQIVQADDADGYIVSVGSDRIALSDEDLLPFEKNYDPFKNFRREKTADELWLDGEDQQALNLPEEIFIAFEPYDEARFEQKCFRIYIVNLIPHKIQFGVELFLGNNLIFKHKAELAKNASFYLTDLFFDQLNDAPVLAVSTEWKIKKQGFTSQKEIKPKVQKFLQPPRQIPLMDKQGYVFHVYEKPEESRADKLDLSKLDASQLKISLLSQKQQQTHKLGEANAVIDLHIEKLTGQFKKMTDAEIIDFQLRTFEQYLERALAGNLPRLKVIHGLGAGKLRQLIHHLLKKHPQVKSFSNQPDIEHAGGGITFVYF